MTTDETYRRGQVEWMLWRLATLHQRQPETPPPAFLARIKRLLEIDRTDIGDSFGFAFGEAAPEGKGNERAFTAFDGFVLGMAMEMLDGGMKPLDIVYLLRHMRQGLQQEYQWIMRWPVHIRDRVLAKRMPDWPSYEASDGQRLVDFRVYAVLRKVEITEVLHKPATGPLFQRSEYCRGIEALSAYLNEKIFAYRKGMVVEIGQTARLVSGFLAEAPLIRRGRS